jgi:hypothetical protein
MISLWTNKVNLILVFLNHQIGHFSILKSKDLMNNKKLYFHILKIMVVHFKILFRLNKMMVEWWLLASILIKLKLNSLFNKMMILILFPKDHRCLFKKIFTIRIKMILFKISLNLKVQIKILDKVLSNKKEIILKKNIN